MPRGVYDRKKAAKKRAKKANEFRGLTVHKRGSVTLFPEGKKPYSATKVEPAPIDLQPLHRALLFIDAVRDSGDLTAAHDALLELSVELLRSFRDKLAAAVPTI